MSKRFCWWPWKSFFWHMGNNRPRNLVVRGTLHILRKTGCFIWSLPLNTHTHTRRKKTQLIWIHLWNTWNVQLKCTTSIKTRWLKVLKLTRNYSNLSHFLHARLYVWLKQEVGRNGSQTGCCFLRSNGKTRRWVETTEWEGESLRRVVVVCCGEPLKEWVTHHVRVHDNSREWEVAWKGIPTQTLTVKLLAPAVPQQRHEANVLTLSQRKAKAFLWVLLDEVQRKEKRNCLDVKLSKIMHLFLFAFQQRRLQGSSISSTWFEDKWLCDQHKNINIWVSPRPNSLVNIEDKMGAKTRPCGTS